MTPDGWLQILVFAGIVAALVTPVGAFLHRLLEDPRIRGLEGLFYRVIGVDPSREMGLRGYAGALLAFSAVGCGMPCSSR